MELGLWRLFIESVDIFIENLSKLNIEQSKLK